MTGIRSLPLLFLLVIGSAWSQPTRSVLVVYEGKPQALSPARGDGRQMAALLGHFRTTVTVLSAEEYRAGQMEKFDVACVIGHSLHFQPPAALMADVGKRTATLLWMYTGIQPLARSFPMGARLGMSPLSIDTVTAWNTVRRGSAVFTKEETNLVLMKVTDPSRCAVIATAQAKRASSPYVLRSGNFWYVADNPFAYATESDRYLLFADLLHDVLGEYHPVSHKALLRIEDVHPLEDPDRLRDVADVLYDEGVPFIITLIPFYVDPTRNERISLSDKPDLVDAIHYMVSKGGTVAMHGSTHQYKGVTAADFEFWDVSRSGPIKEETLGGDRDKILAGVEECMRNGIYPVLWETPHYTGSQTAYAAAASIFSTAMEQRLAIDNADYSQYFPYLIYRDNFGQKIYPENLGYIPFDPDDPQLSIDQVTNILKYAGTVVQTRDGWASCFYHSFVPLENLKRLVQGIKALGFTYIDVKNDVNFVRLPNRAIVTGKGEVTLTLVDQYLQESWIQRDGSVGHTQILPDRIRGSITRTVQLSDGSLYVAQPTELREHSTGFFEGLWKDISTAFSSITEKRTLRAEARVGLLWDEKAHGGAMLDQRSFLNAFRWLNIPVDTLPARSTFSCGPYNLIVAPYGSVDVLSDAMMSRLVEWVRTGGNCILDAKTELSKEFGIVSTNTTTPVSRLRDRLFPDEAIAWRVPEPLSKFEALDDDEIFATDEESGAPVVIGREFEKGKILYFGCRFDPVSDAGYSRFPYLAHYVTKFFKVFPIIRRDNLELYFDPGYRNTISVEDLVKMWTSVGIRAIHVATWHEYPKYTYDYDKLIELCHANGILVYGWIEPPQVSQKFWIEHPEWREKNRLGQDVRPSWRYPMAMTDPACVNAMVDKYRDLFEKHDFDGVNIGEVYFESGVGGPDEPNLLTPMHPSARADMKRRAGFDPVSLLDPSSPLFWKRDVAAWKKFEDYRVEFMTHMHERLLRMLLPFSKKRPGFDLVVTALDNLHSPELRRNHGIDIEAVLSLRALRPFVLNVEDPLSRWSEDPRRYESIATRYAALLGKDLALDVNILSFRTPEKPTLFPTLVQTGTEAFMLQAVTSRVAPRVITYAESSINPQDLSLMSYASASPVQVTRSGTRMSVSSPTSFTLTLDSDHRAVTVDGEIFMSAGDGRFLIPAGSHTINTHPDISGVFSADELRATLLSISGNLLYERGSVRSVDFGYESDTRCLITLNKRPEALYIDGREQACVPMKGSGRYSLMLPPGRHHVHLVTQGAVWYGINLTSLWSSTAIVLFGLLACIALLVFYIIIRIQRRPALRASGGSRVPVS